MNVDFGKGATAVQEPVKPTQALVPAAPAPGVPAQNGLLLGDKLPDLSEIIFPRVNLVQGIGKLKDTFIPGSIIFGQQVILFCPPDVDVTTGNVRRAATPPVTITVLGFRDTRYCEKVEGGARGLIVNTPAEVAASGGTLDWKEWNLKKGSGMKRFEPLADALVLIERPVDVKDDDTVFIFPADGKKYAVALWGMRGVSYTAAAKGVFFTQRSIGCLRGGYPTMSWSVSTFLKPFQGGKSAWVPVCVPRGKSSPELLELAKQILTGAAAPPPVDPADANAGE